MAKMAVIPELVGKIISPSYITHLKANSEYW